MIEARLDRRGRLVVAPILPGLRDRLSAVPGARWAALEGGYVFPATTAAAANLRAVLEALGSPATWTPEAAELLERADGALEAREHRTADELPDLPDRSLGHDGHPPAWLHQRQAYAFARGQEAAGLWVAMGGGKSRIAVNLCLEDEPAHDRAETVLVVAPRSVVDDDGVWAREFALWSDRIFHVGGRVLGRKGPKAKPSVADRVRQLERDEAHARALGQSFVAVVTWDAFWRGELAAWLLARTWDVGLYDEIHRAKAPGGKAARFLDRLRPRVRRRYGLSGTPIPHSRLDAYSVYRALDPGVYGTSYARFKARYARTVPLPNAPRAEKVIGWQNEDEFDRHFHSIAYVWEKDRDVLGLEEPRWLERRFNLAAATKATYLELDQELIADVGKGVVVAGNALVRLLRLAQVTSGMVKTADDVKVRIGDERRRALAEVLEDLDQDEPIVVVCRFTSDHDDVHHVAAAQGRSSAELSGRVKSLDLWKAGKRDVLALQIQAGSVGIDLTRARYCVLSSVGFSLGDYLQVLERLDRPGQVSQVVFIKLVAMLSPDHPTIDLETFQALEGRQDAVAAVLANRQKG